MKKISAKEALHNAVLKLMKTSDIPDIGVTSLCKQAGVSRTTFYRYYSSADDIVKEMEDELLGLIRNTQNLDRKTSKMGKMRSPGPVDLMRGQILHEHSELIQSVTGIHGDPSFSHKAVSLIREGLKAETSSLNLSKRDEKVLTEFILAGYFRCISLWINEHPDISPEEAYACQVRIAKALTLFFNNF